MKRFRTNRVSQLGVFSLNNVQIYLGEVSNDGRPSEKGMSIEGTVLGSLPAERAFILSADGAEDLVKFLDQILSHELPSSVSVKIGFLEKIYWNVKKFNSKWHHGGGFVGNFSYGGTLGGSMVSATITKKAAEDFRECLVKNYTGAA